MAVKLQKLQTRRHTHRYRVVFMLQEVRGCTVFENIRERGLHARHWAKWYEFVR
jgi:hypothetical protein